MHLPLHLHVMWTFACTPGELKARDRSTALKPNVFLWPFVAILTVETSTKPPLKDKEWNIALAREEGEGEAKCRTESPGPISCLCLPPPPPMRSLRSASLHWLLPLCVTFDKRSSVSHTYKERCIPSYRVFSHVVTAAILVSQNNETAARLVSQTNPVGVELFSYANVFFCSNKFA